MSRVISFSTDKASLVVFDPEVLQSRIRAKADWWERQPQHVVEEVAEGQVGVFSIGRHGSYRTALRVGSGLSEAELPFAVATAEGHGLLVTSGQVFVGAAERLPGEGRGKSMSQIPDTGELVEVALGTYEITVHVLHWRKEDQFYDEDNELLPTAPADYVLELTPIEACLEVRTSPPALRDLIPRVERKGQAKVAHQPRRRRESSTTSSGSSSGRKRRGRVSAPVGTGSGPPRAPRHVPEEVAPFQLSRVLDAFREVLHADTLHPPETYGVRLLRFCPRETRLLSHDLEGKVLLTKFTRTRELLRVLEAKTNKLLSPCDAAEVHAPLTGLYESLDDLLTYLSHEAASAPPKALPRVAPPPPL
jgi:hypothetical protein